MTRQTAGSGILTDPSARYMGALLESRLQNQESIFLVGMMAVGKTTIGKLLAGELNYSFYDTDDVIRERSGADIPWIFDVEGEQGFRNREQQVIEEFTQMPSVVLATGGGAVVREANRKALSVRGLVVYLYADLDTLAQRASTGNQRPMLVNHNLKERLAELITERGPLYSEIADICIESVSSHPQNTVRQLMRQLHGGRRFE